MNAPHTLFYCQLLFGYFWFLFNSISFKLPLSFTVASSLHFDGTQYMKISMPGESKTEVEDISLRFSTVRPHGLLFLTASEETKDIMELLLESGAIKLKLNLGSGTRVSKFLLSLKIYSLLYYILMHKKLRSKIIISNLSTKKNNW